MMKKIFDILVTHYRAVVWTVFYVAVMWVVLRGLFGFNMFSGAHWTHMLHMHLHGFSGLVFGLLVLAAVPLYVATTVLTLRNKSVPIKVPMPNCFMPPAPPPPAAPAEPVVTERETLPVLPHGIPQEMRESFMRARKNYGTRQMSVFNKAPFADAPIVAQKSETPRVVEEPKPDTNFTPIFEHLDGVHDTETGLPIPTDFDISADSDVPVFADINFDDDDDEVSDDNVITEKESDLYEFLVGAGIDASMQDGLIIANGFAIASHMDEDFWVADELDWFGAGKQKPSPIAELVKIKEKFKPVLYLGATNIMDFETISQDWRDNGITIVTDRDELLRLVQA
ncbi:MAG: hypothetical protein J5611_02740 [Alphaproteobacteria bacterium]|nr:hypothetical protein [Alphaproteobacteria bacterium]